MRIPAWVFALRDGGIYPCGKGQTFQAGRLMYETYGLLVPLSDIDSTQIKLRETLPIPLEDGGFREDAELEQAVYERVVKPYLGSIGCDGVFMRVGSESICDTLQKHKDIDILADSGIDNASISIKAVRRTYSRIFWEFEKNSNTHEAGWGLYSEATWHFYLMAMGKGLWLCIRFKNAELRDKLKAKGEALLIATEGSRSAI